MNFKFFVLAAMILNFSSSAFAIGESVYLYNEPVADVYGNGWYATTVNNENPILVIGKGKTVDFVGLLEVNCENAVHSQWIYATNFGENDSSVVPLGAILQVRQLFCQQ